jgi:hypothetical protein
MNRAQARAFGAGTTAALERKKDNLKTTFTVEYPAQFSESQITDAVKHALFVRGGLNPATARLDVFYGLTDIRTILSEKDAALKLEQKRSQQMATEMERLQNQIAEMKAHGETRVWITMKELAAREHCHHSTIWRAYKAGRLTAWPNGGGLKKSQYLCDPATYIRATGKQTKTE